MWAERGRVILRDRIMVRLEIKINCEFFKVRSVFMEDLSLCGADWKGGYWI